MATFRVTLAEKPAAVFAYLAEHGPSTASTIASAVTNGIGTYSSGLGLLHDLGLVTVDRTVLPYQWGLTDEGRALVADSGAQPS